MHFDNLSEKIKQHQARLQKCTACPDMIGPVVMGNPVQSSIMLIGQAPGDKEGVIGKPFAWTAGKTLFKWFDSIGLDETNFRKRVYMAAVCRCFPGKKAKGGDRVPSQQEIAQCSQWMKTEFDLLQPELLLPVGKLAITQFMKVDKLADVIGQQYVYNLNGSPCDLIPLPHPSGASTWHRTEPGKTLLDKALKLIETHPAWKNLAGPSDLE